MDILNIFYNYIIKEASEGNIYSYFSYNICFSTRIDEINFYMPSKIESSDLFIPTLNIKNKKIFDELLIKYVNLCLEFYDNTNFENDVIEQKEYDTLRVSKVKTIIALLLAMQQLRILMIQLIF